MAKDFTHPKVVASYDMHIRQLIPGYELIHLQIQAILKSRIQHDSKILIVGCGTGYELSYLLNLFPNASFVALDPSLEMLQKAKLNIVQPDQLNRVEFLHQTTQALTTYPHCFDVALSILVSHFVPFEEKGIFFKDIFKSLKDKGLCLNFDLMKMVQDHHKLALKYATISLGLSEIQSTNMLERLDHDFYLNSVKELQDLYIQTGFKSVENFTQILNFHGFIAQK